MEAGIWCRYKHMHAAPSLEGGCQVQSRLGARAEMQWALSRGGCRGVGRSDLGQVFDSSSMRKKPLQRNNAVIITCLQKPVMLPSLCCSNG